jgi:hypothetical protein
MSSVIVSRVSDRIIIPFTRCKTCRPQFFAICQLQCTLDNPVTCAKQIWTGLSRGPGYPSLHNAVERGRAGRYRVRAKPLGSSALSFVFSEKSTSQNYCSVVYWYLKRLADGSDILAAPLQRPIETNVLESEPCSRE